MPASCYSAHIHYSLPQQTMSAPQPWKFPYYYKMGHNITWRIISRGSSRFPYLWSCLLGNKISTYVLFLTEFGNHSQHPPANQRRLFSKTNGFNNKFYVKLLPVGGSRPPCTRPAEQCSCLTWAHISTGYCTPQRSRNKKAIKFHVKYPAYFMHLRSKLQN